MIKTTIVIVIFFILLISATQVNSQIELPQANITFFIQSIIIDGAIPEEGELVGILKLKGDLSNLRIRWNAWYWTNETKNIGVICYLNCPNPGNPEDPDGWNITKYCAGYQNCSYLGAPGNNSCNIPNPQYNFIASNNVTCKFYDPAYEEFYGPPYPTTVFAPTNYTITVSPITVSVGKTVALPIKIKSTGLIPDNLNVSIASIINSQYVLIEGTNFLSDRVYWNKTIILYPKVTFLQTGNFKVQINATSTATLVRCTDSVNCSYLGDNNLCWNGRCGKTLIIDVSVGSVSLPEFGIVGIVQIILIATLLFIEKVFISNKRKKI